MTDGVSKNYGLPQLTEAQLVDFMREHIEHGVVFVKYHAGTATVLKHEDVYAKPCEELAGIDDRIRIALAHLRAGDVASAAVVLESILIGVPARTGGERG